MKLNFLTNKKMKNNFKINPEVTKVEFRVSVPAQELTRLGWEFNAPEYEGDINLLFTNHGNNGVVCLWSFAIDGADCEDSGDTEKSIEDLLSLLNSGVIEYNEDLDYSEDGDSYCPWVIETKPIIVKSKSRSGSCNTTKAEISYNGGNFPKIQLTGFDGSELKGELLRITVCSAWDNIIITLLVSGFYGEANIKCNHLEIDNANTADRLYRGYMLSDSTAKERCPFSVEYDDDGEFLEVKSRYHFVTVA